MSATPEEIAPGTKVQYTRKAERIRKRFVTETGREPDLDCAAFLHWLDEHYAHLAPPTRRQYHAALTYYQKCHHPECIPGPIPQGLLNGKAIRAEYGHRTSGAKSKTIPDSVERCVLNSLRNPVDQPRGSIYNEWAEFLFRAGLRFGLRPKEWHGSRFTYLDVNELALEVPNGKRSGNRAFGLTRTLIVDEARLLELDPHALDAAAWLVENSRPLSEAEYEHVLRQAEQQMRRILKRCGTPCQPRYGNVTLYTARHQFAANAKSDGLTRSEIAALMGHASIYTAGEHYGRKRHGRGKFGMHGGKGSSNSGRQTAVTPHIEDLRIVEALEQDRQQRRRRKPGTIPGMG